MKTENRLGPHLEHSGLHLGTNIGVTQVPVHDSDVNTTTSGTQMPSLKAYQCVALGQVQLPSFRKFIPPVLIPRSHV